MCVRLYEGHYLTNSTPTITYGHGILSDLYAATEALGTWTFNNINLPGATATFSLDDILTIEGTLTSVADEYAYAQIDVANTVSTTVYPYFMVRYKTSAASNGLAAKVRVVYTDATSDYPLPSSFSTTWKVAKATLTTGKIIDQIRLIADDDPNSVASGTYDVYYDFFLVHAGTFTFPNTQYGSEFTPPPRYATIPIPSRVGDVTQNLGSESATWQASCNLDLGDWKRASDYVNGEVFIDIAHNTFQHPFQWLDTGKEQFKATLETPRFIEHSDSHTLDLLFREYRRSSGSNESYVERFGLNL
jgi:hypothetical protein